MRSVLVALFLIGGLAAGRTGPLNNIWSLLTSGWSAAGLGMDPDGEPKPAPTTDGGLGMDPDGKPRS